MPHYTVHETHTHMGPSRARPLYRGVLIVWYLVGLLEALLAFRFLLKLSGANQAAGFTQFIYAITDIFVAPFIAVFRITRVEGVVFEWTTLLAMFVYWLLAWAIIKLFVISKPISRDEATRKLDLED